VALTWPSSTSGLEVDIRQAHGLLLIGEWRRMRWFFGDKFLCLKVLGPPEHVYGVG
jgi:hypothetical protein